MQGFTGIYAAVSLRGTIPAAGLRLGEAISAACNSSSSPLLHTVGWSILRFQLPNLAILIHTRLLFDTTPHFWAPRKP